MGEHLFLMGLQKAGERYVSSASVGLGVQLGPWSQAGNLAVFFPCFLSGNLWAPCL